MRARGAKGHGRIDHIPRRRFRGAGEFAILAPPGAAVASEGVIS
jgi:hypothetical protein